MPIRNNSPWIDGTPDAARFPRLDGETGTDVVVVGGGMVGVLAAWHLRRKGKRVILLEKNRVCTGDSGATTGFLTKVPDVSFATLERRHGAEFLRRLFDASREAQREVFDIIAENAIACDLTACSANFGSYAADDETLGHEWEIVRAASPEAAWTEGETSETGPFVRAIRFGGEGKFNCRKFLFALLELMSAKGGSASGGKGPDFAAYEESEVSDIDLTGADVRVRTDRGTVIAKKLVMATGRPIEYFAELQPLVDHKITYVIAAKKDGLPLSEDVFWDTFDPYFYFRKIDPATVLIGGCDIDADKTHQQTPFEKLEAFARERFGKGLEITNAWSGSIFHTVDGLPYAFEHPHEKGKVYVATGFGGNGMVFGAMAAQAVADLVAGENTERTGILSLERGGVAVAKASHRVPVGKEKMEFARFAAISEFAERNAVCKPLHDRKIVVYKTDDGYFATDNGCTHQGGSLCDGRLEGKVIECPLHGARFDVTTGAVLAPPATRALRRYAVRVAGDSLEVEVPVRAMAETEEGVFMPAKRSHHWAMLLRFALFATAFWSVEFALQYFWLSKGDLRSSLVRGSALSAATFIASALSLSAIFRWVPKLARHWRIRRYFGVAGVVFAVTHAFSVLKFYFDFDVKSVFFSLNPLENPIIFAEIAMPILIVMAATSTDRAVQMLTPKVWKTLHRFVYVAFWAVIFHFLLINPPLLKNPPGYFLLAVTAFALFGQLYWFIRIAGKRRFRTLGSLVGAAIILMYLITGYFAYLKLFP